MKTLKYFLLGVVAIGIGSAAVLLYPARQPAEVESQPLLPPAQTQVPAPPAPEPAAVPEPIPTETATTQSVVAKAHAPIVPATLVASPLKASTASAATSAGGGGKKQWQDPDARVALALVGVDPAAEEYWTRAINNPDLPPHERKDLIEDLNEEGLDPKNLTPDDLPLILARIRIIERHLPDAMDAVNAAAFAEAHKDLLKMLTRFP